MNRPKKKTFQVEDYGSIDACLQAMEYEGYTPVRRIEKPFFKEATKGIELAGRIISFEGILAKPEQ